MKTTLLVTAATCLLWALSTVTATAQTAQPQSAPADQSSNPALWQAKFNNGGHYLIKLGSISSVSRHEYVANGTARVVEVTIAASGPIVARFYWLEPVGKDSGLAPVQTGVSQLQSITQTATQNLDSNATKLKVVKDYPNTTHAHTVEYTLQTEDALKSLFQSLVRAVDTGTGRTWLESGK